MKNEYVINGAKFSTEKGFYKEVERKLTLGLDYNIGRNLNAFNDVLRGGFGAFECDEKIILRWKNLNKSRERLNERLMNRILEILNNHENITFIED